MNDKTRSRLKHALGAAVSITEAVPVYDRARIEADVIVEGGYIHQFQVSVRLFASFEMRTTQSKTRFQLFMNGLLSDTA